MAGEQNVDSQSGAPKGYIGDTRGQNEINPDPNYWINTLIKNNPTLKADPYLVTSLTQQFKNSTNPAQLAHSTLMAKYLNGTADQIGLSNLYPRPDTIYDAPAYRAPDKWWQATNSTSNWFSKLLQPVGNVLGSAIGGFVGAISTPEAGKQVGNFWRAVPSDFAGPLIASPVSKLAVDVGRLATGNIGDLTAGKGLPAWQWKDPLYLGPLIHETLSGVGHLPFMADAYMTNLKSQINKNGIGTALAQQYANLLSGYLVGGALGAAGGEGGTVLDAAAQAGETASAQDAQIIESLTQKLKTEGSLTPEEQAALEKTKQDLLTRDPNALYKSAYQNGINEFKTQYPIEHGILEQDLARGSITQQEYDQAIAKGISSESQPAFNAASEAINSEQAVTSAAQDAIQASKLNASNATFKKIAELATYPVAIPLKGLGAMARTLGSTPAQITYLLGALQAQNNPEDAYIWQLAEQGKVLNADGTTQDLGIEIANSLGIDGMWGTSVRDLVDVGLKWIVDDPIAAFSRIVKESRGVYGMTGVLNKWFSGTGIREVGDVERAYAQYSSVRRAVSWIATHGAAAINQRFGALFLGPKLIEKLAAAQTDSQVLAVLEEASQAINMVDRVTTMPSMSWYTLAKTGLTGEVGKEFSTIADALASPIMPTDKMIEAIEKETGVDITPHDVGYAAGGVAERAKILLSQRLRRQFSMKQMIIEGGRVTDRELVVGSVRSAEGIRKFLVNNFMSHDFANMVTDQLIRYGDDPVKWNNIYNNAMRISLYRRMLASTAHSDFGIFADVMGPEIDDKIYQYTGVTGGGTSLDEALVADPNTASDRTIDPETGKMHNSAVDDKQLGRRMLPNERNMRMLSREIAKVAQNVNKSGGDDLLRSAEKDFEVYRQLAHTANVEAETYLKNFVPEDRSEFATIEEKVTETLPTEIPKSEFYHGSSTEISGVLGDGIGEGRAAQNLFGPGFYTTDNPEIARSYTGKGAKGAEREGKLNKTVHGIRWTGETPPNLVDLEQAAPKEFRDSFNQYLNENNWPSNSELDTKYLEDFKQLLNDPTTTGSKIYSEFRSLLADAHLPMNDADEILQDIAYSMNEKGIDGLRYQGGKYAAKGNGIFHEARIFFDTDKLSIESSTPANKTFEKTVTKNPPALDGYMAKSQEILDRANQMLKGDELKGMTKAERYATVVKYLDGELIKARDAYVTASKKFDELAMMKAESEKLYQIFGTTNVLPFLQHLRGEMLAVQDLGAEMKAAISSSYSSEENIAKQANYIASTATTKEAGEEYKRLFNEEWSTRSSRQVGEKLGIGKLNAAKAYELWAKNTGIKLKSLGDRGMRNNFDVVVDLMQGYLNGWFKLLTLASPAWAERVIVSEVMLNSLRIGGHNFTEAKLVQSIARHEAYLGKVAMGDVERKALRSAISNIILGFDTALAKTLVGKKFDDFLDFATHLYLETDGHMLGGVHSQGDLMAEDGFKHNVVNQVVGIEGKGAEAKIKTSNKVLGETYTKYMAGDSYAGAALYENITRASRGTIFKENARWYEEQIVKEGQRIFDGNPEFYMEQAKEDATKVLQDLGKPLTENNFKVQLKKSLDEKIRELGGRSFSNPSELARLRRESDYHMEGFISSQPAAWRADFRRDREASAKYPNESPHTGWAKTSTDHTMGLSTNINSASGVASVIHPEIIHQIASGDFWSQEQLAKWMREHWEKDDAPSAFPAHEYVGLMSAGNLNIVRKYSDWLHRALLGKMVNTASRDPLFVWEAWQQYQKLLPLVEKGYMTTGEAMAKCQSEALINMSKFVHNPMDKTMWEENMRVVAPYYFAKNQAMRRALRMAGDNFAAFEKYMKINLAVTDYVALAYNQSGIGSFTFPGSQVITGFTNGIVNSWLAAQGLPNYGAGQHMGLESSPASPDSIIITGQTPGIGGFLENVISMPFGPIVTIPAKYVYEQMQYRIPFIGDIIKWVIGPNSMRSSIASDLFPNSTLQNVYKGVYGHMNQNQVSSYLSSELYSIGNEGSNILTKYRNETIDTLLKKGQINKQNINSGLAQQLINYYTARKVSLFLENPNNRTDLQSEANWATTSLYAAKTLTSLATPLSSVIASDIHVQKQLDAIALEKDKNGDFKFPSYTLQVAELLRRFPTELFNTVAHTKSPFSTYLETIGTVKYVENHPQLVKEFPFLSAFMSSQQGADAKYDPVASQILGEFALRQKETPTEYTQAMRVALGNYMYYDVMLPGFQKLYPGTYQDGLSSAGYYAWTAAGKSYGQSMNSAWLSEHLGGNTYTVAAQSYTELQSFMKNPSHVATLTPAQKQYIPLLLDARSAWEKQYKAAAGNTSEQSQLRRKWRDNCTAATTLPGWKDVSTIITGVFRPLPPPQ